MFQAVLLRAGAGIKMLPGLKKNHDKMKQKLESWRDLEESKLVKEAEISTGPIIAGTGRWSWDSGAQREEGERERSQRQCLVLKSEMNAPCQETGGTGCVGARGNILGMTLATESHILEK